MNQSAIFDKPKLWQEYGLTEDYGERIETVRRLMPKDVSSVLDIGCGKGDVINAIQQDNPSLRTVGMDLSIEALAYVQTHALSASLPDAPFPAKSFDVVLCLEVLEHIDEAAYRAARQEIQRLAGRFIIIGVPFKENLSSKQVICGACKTQSHADGHVRSYQERDAAALFEQFTLENRVVTGVAQRREPVAASRIRQRVAGVYYQPAIFHCPRCGHDRAAQFAFHSPLLLRKPASLLNRMLRRMKPLEPYWWIGLYRRQDA
ncbi:MAG: class I SAM-dependent methyltransferase [Candidatus Latescibacterota bacterium]